MLRRVMDTREEELQSLGVYLTVYTVHVLTQHVNAARVNAAHVNALVVQC